MPTKTKSADLELDPAAQVDVEAHKRNLAEAREALAAEFNTLIADTERLLQHTKDVADAGADELRLRINDNIARAKVMLAEGQNSCAEKGQAAIQATEDYVHAKPWQALGIAAGVGFLLGMLSGRR